MSTDPQPAWVIDARTGVVLARCDTAQVAQRLIDDYYARLDPEGVRAGHYVITASADLRPTCRPAP